jgi:hypothetical protein
MLQSPQSCIAGSNGGSNLTVFAAVCHYPSQNSERLTYNWQVLNTVSSPTVNLTLTLQSPRPSGNPVPSLTTTSLLMTHHSSNGPYDIYSTSYMLSSSQVNSTKFDISVGAMTDGFKSTAGLGLCGQLNNGTTSPSIPSGPNLAGYTYQGCRTDSVSSRVLADSSTWSESMTYTACASFCSQYSFFGVEYGTECYCGRTLSNSSVAALEADCNMACTGDSMSVCGGASRINIFKEDVSKIRSGA